MKKLIKPIRFIWYVFVWILYFMMSIKDRLNYHDSIIKNKEVIPLNNNPLDGQYMYGKNFNGSKPERNFSTWKEFRTKFKF